MSELDEIKYTFQTLDFDSVENFYIEKFNLVYFIL